MSLRSQLEAKQRRLGEALAAVTAAEGTPELDGAVEALQADAQAALAAVEAATAELVLAAPPAGDVEALMRGHVGADGMPDYRSALPDLLALSAEDESLRDAGWWREQLERPEWTAGEVSGLLLSVLYLVANGPQPLIPKG